jgi:hypothetical protein
MNYKTQNEKILNHLKKGKRLTALTALEIYGCFRLASRIYELKKKEYNIKTHTIQLHNNKRVSVYYI